MLVIGPLCQQPTLANCQAFLGFFKFSAGVQMAPRPLLKARQNALHGSSACEMRSN